MFLGQADWPNTALQPARGDNAYSLTRVAGMRTAWQLADATGCEGFKPKAMFMRGAVVEKMRAGVMETWHKSRGCDELRFADV